MKAFAAAVLAFICMAVFTPRLVVSNFGKTKLWVLLLIDLLVALAVFVLAWH